MIDLAVTAGIPLVCTLLGGLWAATVAWQPGHARLARQRVRRRAL